MKKLLTISSILSLLYVIIFTLIPPIQKEQSYQLYSQAKLSSLEHMLNVNDEKTNQWLKDSKSLKLNISELAAFKGNVYPT